MSKITHLQRVVLMLLFVLAGGTSGYMIIEGWSFTDSMYMTVITISTVGYGEVHPLSNAGKAFSAVLIAGGVGVALYAFTSLIDYFIRGQIANVFGRRKMTDEIERLHGHFIICGYDPIAQVVASALRNEGTPFVVIDPSQQAISQAEKDTCLCLQGDPSDYDTLRNAGIERARGLLAITDNDAANVFIIVSARGLRSDLLIVARASTRDTVSKLEAVGANRAINPYSSGGERIAIIALCPGVSDFIERVLPGYGWDLWLEEIEVTSRSQLDGKSVGEAQDYCGGPSILAIRKKGKETIAKPSDETPIEAGDRLIILGQREQLRLLEGAIQDQKP